MLISVKKKYIVLSMLCILAFCLLFLFLKQSFFFPTVSPSSSIVASDNDIDTAMQWYTTGTASVTEQWRDYFSYDNDPKYLHQKYLLALYLYNKHKRVDAIPLAIAYATTLWNYDEAWALLKKLPDISLVKDAIEWSVLMRLLINSSDLSFARLKQLKDFINSLKEQKKIDDASYNFYFLIITLIKWDMGNTLFYANQLQWTQYDSRYKKMLELQTMQEAYPHAPDYYLRWLWWMALYKDGWRWPSLHIGQSIRQKDPHYIIADQLVAYGALWLQRRDEAIAVLQNLQQSDTEYADVYQFFQWLAHYFAWQYKQSIALFANVDNKSVYYQDVLRYLLLSYVAVNDIQHAGEVASLLLASNALIIEDIYSIFDLFLYSPIREKKDFSLYTAFPEIVELFLQRCQQQFSDKSYVCLYGKAWKMLIDWESEKAFKLLLHVVQRYPRSELYKMLGDLSLEQGNPVEAERYYQEWFLLKETEFWTEIFQVSPTP